MPTFLPSKPCFINVMFFSTKHNDDLKNVMTSKKKKNVSLFVNIIKYAHVETGGKKPMYEW